MEEKGPAIPARTYETDFIRDAKAWYTYVCEQTSPGMNLGFFLIIGSVIALHEYEPLPVSILLLVWIIIQIDVNNFLFLPTLMNTLGRLLFYLIIGALWSIPKLAIDVVRNGVLTDKCDAACIVENYKWRILNSMIHWPASIIFVLIRDAPSIFRGYIFNRLRNVYIATITWVLSNEYRTFTWSDVLFFLFYIVIYVGVGFSWSCIKLIIELSKGTFKNNAELADKKYLDFVGTIKWNLLEWTFIWPSSLLMSVLHEPFRFISDFFFNSVIGVYSSIVKNKVH
jgi:hypothetical protein